MSIVGVAVSTASSVAKGFWSGISSLWGKNVPTPTPQQQNQMDILFGALISLGRQDRADFFKPKFQQGASDIDGWIADMWNEVQDECRKKGLPPFAMPPPVATSRNPNSAQFIQWYNSNVSKIQAVSGIPSLNLAGIGILPIILIAGVAVFFLFRKR